MTSLSAGWWRILAGPLLMILTALALVSGGEVMLRLASGQPLFAIKIDSVQLFRHGKVRDLSSFAHLTPLARGIEEEWINIGPPPLPGRDEPDAELMAWSDAAYEAKWPGLKSNLYRQWNAEWIRNLDCNQASPIQDIPVPLYSFEPPRGNRVPVYRYLASRTDPLGMRTNRFGWRGPEIPLDKPPGTVRIAFIGASTTVGAKSCSASYPEYVVHWLNQWAASERPDLHFDLINAGREGLNAVNIAAVLRTEVLPMEPDLILYYEGVNHLRSWIDSQDDLAAVPRSERAKISFRDTFLKRASRYSILAWRLDGLMAALRRTGSEPVKPPHVMAAQEEADPSSLDPFDPNLPYGLSPIIRQLDIMKIMSTREGSQLAMASFVFLVEEDMIVDRWRSGLVEDFYLKILWPLSYAEVRKVADFQNRVFKDYARSRFVPFVDLAGSYPQDPSLFIDGVHFSCDGARLQAWIVLQKLMPLVRNHIEGGRWPRPDREPLASHPGIPAPTLVEKSCNEQTRAPLH